MSLQSSPGALALAPDRLAQGYLCADQLAKRFPGMDAPAVDEVSLAIHKGEIFALLGSSGCGKSTLLRMLAGFEKPTSGRVVLNGVDITGLAPHERPINMMFQSFALFPHLNTWDNIAFGLKREGMPKPQIQARVEEMLGLVQLESFATRKPHQLSGGQQQRVALARSLAKKPQLLLLDEPLGALDKQLRERTQFELVNILKSVGVTCVLVTHDQQEAMAMASRIAVMSDGRVLQVGTPREIYEQPKCRFVADFIGNVNMFEGVLTLAEAQRSEISVAEGVVKLGRCIDGALGMAAAIALRPENISLSKARPAAIGSNLFSGRVREIAYFGSYNSFIVEMGSGRMVKITELNNVRQDHDFITPDDAVYFWWDDRAPVVLTR
jgi:putrescine transport system ATP-binding protein